MSADKRTVTTDALETLGTIITPAEKRDAIHLAVENVIAGEDLMPGENVSLILGYAFAIKEYRNDLKAVGIVDPFLKEPVRTNQRFWLVVYPRQIKSLRHVWEHPDFPDSGETNNSEGAFQGEKVVKILSSAETSEKWLREFATDVSVPYNKLMIGAKDYLLYDQYMSFGDLLEGKWVPDEFWTHYENVTGEKVSEGQRGSFFSCSC
jgi:hypothetical protein